jgi:hypothetical protein
MGGFTTVNNGTQGFHSATSLDATGSYKERHKIK